MPALEIHVWSDVACPWCYVGKRRLEAALADFAAPARVRWRAFELNPVAPRVSSPGPYAERLAAKYGMSLEQGEAMIRTMTAAGAEEGLQLRFDRIRPGNTFDAHRLVHLAAEHGRADATQERFFRAYLTDGEAIGEPETLARLAREAGLPGQAVAEVLEGDAYAAAVRADEEEAQRLGIHGVPHFRVGREALSGAQPPEQLLLALRAAAGS